MNNNHNETKRQAFEVDHANAGAEVSTARSQSIMKQFGVGAIAAFAETVLLQPTLYAKNARAQGLPLSLNPRILYRGSFLNIFNEVQCMGVQFSTTELFNIMLSKNNGPQLSLETKEITSAIGGGAVSSLFASPLELIMIQQQIRGGSVFKAISGTVSATRGPRTLFKGISMTMCRDAIYVGAMLGLTPALQKRMENVSISTGVASFYASIIGGVVAAVPSHPFDVIKTCIQGDLEQKKFTSVGETTRRLLQQGGIKRIFNGCLWRTLNIVGTVYIVNSVQNWVQFRKLLD